MANDKRVKQSGMNSISFAGNITLNITFSIYAIVCIFPLLLVLAVSLSDEADIVDYGYRIIPKSISLISYQFILSSGDKILSAYGYTIVSTIAGTILALLITSSLAYPLSRKSFKYRNKFAFYVYFTMLFNGGMVPLYIVYTQIIPLKNSIYALIIPNLVSGFYVLLMRTYFSQNISDSIVESAEIDGASTFRIFFTMVLPLAKPVLATVGLFTAMGYWNNYFRNLLFVYDDRVMNLQYLLFRMQSEIEVMNTDPQLIVELGKYIPQETSRMAMVILTIGPIIFLYPFLQRYFIKGLTIGSVKG